MFAPDDTIVAVATPSGRGGLGVVRLSGPHAASLARHLLDHSAPLLARHATVSRIVDAGGPSVEAFDRVEATFFPRPGSYTGDDVVEISLPIHLPISIFSIVFVTSGAVFAAAI